MKVTKTIQPSPAGDITLVKIENASGASVTLSSLGAGIYSVIVPDRDGRLDNVVLGYADPADYMADGPCAGKVPGRYANRIAGGHLDIDGRVYQLPINNGPNSLHGGPAGFQNRIWDVEAVGKDFVTFRLLSPDGEMGYPGNLVARATYTWTDGNELTLDLSATTDAPTVVNLTNHAYWNLNGDATGSALGHRLTLHASRYLPTDSTLIPTGELAPVAGTPMDFTTPRTLGERIGDDFPALRYGKGYDACWVIDPRPDRVAAVLEADRSSRKLTVLTDQPGVQVYTGNWLEGCPASKGGTPYRDYDAVAIECQGFPDAPNQPSFPSQRLNPGETYLRHITFLFGTR